MFGSTLQTGQTSGIVNTIKSKMTPMVIGITIFGICLIGVSIYYYFKYVAPKLSPTYNAGTGVDSGPAGSNQAEIILFYVDWCPHCKTAKPEWEKVRDKYQGQQINGYVVTFTEVNCTNETAEVSQMIEKYSIEGYPTIKLLKDDEIIEFDAKPTKDTLSQFLTTVL
jgi:thiol-disulfide isomerase/thioredoxin